MFGLGMGEVLLILLLAVVFIGPKKLPDLARSLGKSLREFQRAKDEILYNMKYPDQDTSANDPGQDEKKELKDA